MWERAKGSQRKLIRMRGGKEVSSDRSQCSAHEEAIDAAPRLPNRRPQEHFEAKALSLQD